MRPTLSEYDAVEVAPCDAEDLKRGELVVFKQGKILVCHRFLGRVDGALKTQGDNLWNPDNPVHASNLVGRVTRILRSSGRSSRVGRLARWKGLTRVAFRRAKWKADRLIRKR